MDEPRWMWAYGVASCIVGIAIGAQMLLHGTFQRTYKPPIPENAPFGVAFIIGFSALAVYCLYRLVIGPKRR